MQTVHVGTGRPYHVLVGTMLLEQSGPLIREALGDRSPKIALVTDTNVGPLFAQIVCTSLEEAGFELHVFTFEAGEERKRPATYIEILEFLAAHKFDRDDAIVALGGGVVGDLAGFAAATYARGIPYVQMPTSLLAMVDSSVGGKTAIDLMHGKNLAGSFWQPSLVIADVGCLATLSPQQFADGAGEVIKHAAIADPELFSALEEQPLTLGTLHRNVPFVETVVARNIQIKRNVVVADERETGLRQILNFGHTVGHAIESAEDYRLGHGSCVAAGMCVVARACAARGVCTVETAQRLEATCLAHCLPVRTQHGASRLVEHASHDKKRHGNGINTILLEDIGRVRIERLSLADFETLIDQGL